MILHISRFKISKANVVNSYKLKALADEFKQPMPTLYLSVDSGFRSKSLLAYCEGCGIIYIGVPKVNHIVGLDGKKQKVHN